MRSFNVEFASPYLPKPSLKCHGEHQREHIMAETVCSSPRCHTPHAAFLRAISNCHELASFTKLHSEKLNGQGQEDLTAIACRSCPNASTS